MASSSATISPVSANVPAGIGGWLILPAIGLVVGPIAATGILLLGLTLLDDVTRAGYGSVYAMELLANALLLFLVFHVAYHFFRKSARTPKLFIRLLLLYLATGVVLLAIELSIGADMFAIETGKQIIRDVLAAAIWIPYFRKSVRVRNTFVN